MSVSPPTSVRVITIVALATSVLLVAAGEARAVTVTLQADPPVGAFTRTGDVGGVGVTLGSSGGHFSPSFIDDSGAYADASLFGTLAAAPGTVGDFLDLGYGVGEIDTVTVTFDAPVQDPALYILDVDDAGVSVIVSSGGTTFTNNADGQWTGNTFTSLGAGSTGLGAFGAVEYAGLFPAGSSFTLFWDHAPMGSELVAIGIGSNGSGAPGAVPEPATGLILAAALGVAALRRRARS